MKKKVFLALLVCVCGLLAAQDVVLPAPARSGGKPLMDALNHRQTTRSFSSRELPKQTLSDLLWAAWGFNRGDKRTAPSAMNKQLVTVYVSTSEAIYKYDAKGNALRLVVKGDYRKDTGMQPFVGTAAVELVYVAESLPKSTDMLYADCGFIAQNVYLFCSSEGIGTVVRGSVPKDGLAKVLGLSDKNKILLCQTVGYKK